MSNLKSVVASAMNAKITKKAEETDSIKTPIKSITIMNNNIILNSLGLKEMVEDWLFTVDKNQSYLEWSLDVTKYANEGFHLTAKIKDLKLIGTVEIVDEEGNTNTKENVELQGIDLNEIYLEMESSVIAVGSGIEMCLKDINISKDGTIHITIG